MRKRRNFRNKIFHISTFILLSMLIALFFVQENKRVKERDLFESYTKRAIELANKNDGLKIGFLEKNHLENIQTIAKELNFEKAEKIHYLRVLEGTVVAK